MRHIWMFPRNKRRMVPLDTALILRAMVVASELGVTWGGDQGQQNQFSKLLEEYGLKAGGDQRDAKPGGARTYEAQMRSLGLLYKSSSGGTLKLTQAGEDLVELIEPAKTFEYQILKFQYPSSYSMSRNVDLDRSIKIRPFLFILQLANDPEINGMSDKDIIVPVVHGRSAESFEECKQLILKMRKDGADSVVPDSTLIRTSKTLNSTYSQRMEDISSIANTFKNVLQGSGIADLRDVDGDIRLFPRHDIRARITEISQLPLVDFLNLPEEQATLKYGTRFGAIKDTRRTFMPSKNPELITKSALIYQRFLDDVDLPVTQVEVNEFVVRMSKECQLPRDEVLSALSPILANADHYTGARLIELSKGGLSTAEAFEKNVAKIFEVDFGYSAEWTGRAYRQRTGGFMDVFVVEIDRNVCGIIDTKSMKVYDLPHQDASKAITTYIDAATELYGSRNLELKFVAYVSHLIGSGASVRAEEIYRAKGVPVSLMSSYGLNSMRDDREYRGAASKVTHRLSENPVNLVL